MTTLTLDEKARLEALRKCLDDYGGVYKKLRRVGAYGDYVAGTGGRADEEILTEPVLRGLIEDVLGFPKGEYLEQLGTSGRKPDFTPSDVIGHPFVLDSKASGERLAAHEAQIRRYMNQRHLDYGVLFNLREIAVCRRHQPGFDASLSFSILPLWRYARGEAMPPPELERFQSFCRAFHYRKATMKQKIAHIAGQANWSAKLKAEDVSVDIEALVERLRRLSVLLADDAAAQVEQLEERLELNPGFEERLLDELRLLANDIAPGVDAEQLPSTIKGWRSNDGLVPRVWRQYLLRVAYLALTRILLYRAWEDVEFVESYLYDGGFGTWYDRLGRNARRVLDEAFLHGGQHYPWLFGRENNYDWYHPREPALVDVLYMLAPQPLGKLDADVLGALYETYVEDIDRDRLGQFFTPRSVVRFMLDRARFAEGKGADGVFRVEGDDRKPRQVLDFATGSGGFLVESARRIIDAVEPGKADAKSLREAFRAIVNGFTGGEISPFPYYLTEVNLLLQVSRLLGPLRAAEHHAVPSFGALGVLPVDTLSSKSAPHTSLDVDAPLRADHAELLEDDRVGLVPLDGDKRDVYRDRLRKDGFFDLVVGNPPYVTEANNKPLFDRLRRIAAWKGIYRGKTDYLYYFLWLAVEKLAPGGRLCVITPAGWMNAGAADFLREKLASELRLEELFLFGSYRLFATESSAPTPTVESAILVATKAKARKNHKLRVVALEDEAAAPSNRDELLAEMARRARGKPGRKSGIHVHDVLQSELRPQRPWAVKHSAQDVAVRVVAHLQAQLDDATAPVESLERGWKIFQGIQTGADAYSARIQKRLSAEVRSAIESVGGRTGDPILELSPGRENTPPWSKHPEVLAKSPEAQAILYGAVDDGDYGNLVVLRAEPSTEVLSALEPWRAVLSTRAEIARNPRRRWWEAAWPRPAKDMTSPKVIALYRTDRGRFALDETGDWQPSIKLTLAVGREEGAPVAYLCGLLNSELLDLWYAVRGKTPWHVRRNYEPLRMNEMPYRRRPEGDERADRIADLVREIAANRRALLPHRSVVRGLGRIVKDPWKDGPVEVDRAALIAELPATKTISVRLDPALTANQTQPGKPHRDGPDVLVLRSGKAEVGRVEGGASRLDVLETVLAGKRTDDVGEALLPADLAAFEKEVADRTKLVSDLLAQGRKLVEEVERLVCALYGPPDNLTDEVVDHAVQRAVRQTS